MAETATLTRYDITDLNNGKIEGFEVSNPPGWDPISLYYAKALQTMGWNESGKGSAPPAPSVGGDQDPYPGTPNVANTWQYSETPDSYFFWGAMHWWPGNDWEYWNENAPSPQNEYWSHCTHGPAQVEKYFLPWHRAYIYFYEVALRRKVAELGGPESWALPYWNYSYYAPSNGASPWPRSRLPWVFCQTQLPDGSGNPLQLDPTRRGLQPTWPDGQPMLLLPTTPYYSGAYGQKSWETVGANPASGFNATLDGRPHGAVHNDTGNGDGLISPTGWMQNTQTAGFDPIFWLHHSEIDRFWEGWKAAGGQDPNTQTDPDWLTAGDDPVVGRWNFWADSDISNVIVIHPGEMLDPRNLDPAKFPYSYKYHNLPTVPAPKPGGRAIVADAVPRLALTGVPAGGPPPTADGRQIGAADQPVEVRHDPVTAQLSLADEAHDVLRALDEGPPEEARRIILHLDNITAQSPPGNYEVYINDPGADHDTSGEDPHFVGLFSAFGANHRHGEHLHGVSASYDITDIVAYLRARDEWDASAVQVTFVPAVAQIGDLMPVIGRVTIGSVQILTD